MEYELPIGRLDDVFSGPRAVSADERNALYALIIESMRERFGEHLQHLVLYGSTARGEARPYSDIDLWGVIDDEVYGAKFQKPVEWVYGPGKALVYLLSRSAAEALAREVGQAGVLAWQRGEPVQLRMLIARPDEAAASEHTDWVGD